MGNAFAVCLPPPPPDAVDHEDDDDEFESNPDNPRATFTVSTTNDLDRTGTFVVEVFLDKVPLTASNFIALAQTGFYEGLHVHRTIPGSYA